MDKIFPIIVTVYKDPRIYVSGQVYSDAELEELVGYIIDKKLYYTVSFRTEEETQQQ
jgi:hypothetical protein